MGASVFRSKIPRLPSGLSVEQQLEQLEQQTSAVISGVRAELALIPFWGIYKGSRPTNMKPRFLQVQCSCPDSRSSFSGQLWPNMNDATMGKSLLGAENTWACLPKITQALNRSPCSWPAHIGQEASRAAISQPLPLPSASLLGRQPSGPWL